ncbi:MAG: YegS/Rv2252/BmrU family lipid kinase [Oscillospiraceae bacterium]|jgi:YegS/Rv2252/BmrU family lipid kinase|nr:YegS/Rv2252/BmrU family lipid kinase [Oscillospiraceae bacterium]
MSKKMMLLVNPYSGRGISKTALGDIVTQFAERDYIVSVCLTKERGTAAIARENAADYDLLVCVGGDGTLSDTVTGLMDIENPPPIGYIPMGTANDMATTLALSRNINTAVDTILEGHPVPLDVGSYNGEYFTYIAAFGAFTGVSYKTPQSAKRALGHLAYVFGGLADIATIKPQKTRVEFDGGFIEDSFIFGGVTNTTSVAGLVRLQPSDVDLGDGKFEVILVRNPVNVQDFMEILTSVTTNAYFSENVRLIHTSRVKFTFEEPVAFTRDGENGGMHTELLIENRSRAVQIIIDDEKESEFIV